MQISPVTMKLILSSVKDGTASLVEGIGGSPKVLNLAPGTVVLGEVLARQPNGRHIIRISGELLEMGLPRETPVGGSLKMTYVGDKPRLTFAVSTQTLRGTDVSISSAGRWLGSMAAQSPEAATDEAAPNVRTSRIFDSLPADKGAIAVRLKEVVSRSGIFYESHLERWSKGEFPLKELLREPQGERSPLVRPQPPVQPAADISLPPTATSLVVKNLPDVSSPSPATISEPGVEDTLDNKPVLTTKPEQPAAGTKQPGADDSKAPSGAHARTSLPHPAVSDENALQRSTLTQSRDLSVPASKVPTPGFEPPDVQTLPVVRQQLEVLNSGQFVWQGEPWQGQQMEWTIRKDAERRNSSNARSWNTSLRLELPNLGTVSASVSISGNQVSLSISATEADSVKLMDSHRTRLVEGMESCGLIIGGMEVRHDPSS